MESPKYIMPEYGSGDGAANHTTDNARGNSRAEDAFEEPGGPEDATKEKSSEGSQITKSQTISSKTEPENEDKIHPVATGVDDPPKDHHLKFTDSAKHAAGQVSRKLHLHREVARGPSEAKQRRQSSVVAIDHNPHLPLYIHLRNAVYGSLIMFTSFPYWDMAFWSGWSYTWGSILFVIDGFWAWTPQRWPQSEFKGEAEYGVGLLFFIGALFYQLGANMAYFEAINDGSFGGRAMKRHLEGHDEDAKKLMDDKLHMFFGHMIPHHHRDDNDDSDMQDVEKQKHVDPNAGWATRDTDERPGSVYPADMAPPPRRGGVDMGPAEEGEFHEYLTWRWWPTWHALWTYHIREMGYVACVIQLFGATLYGICGVLSLPGILSKFNPGQTIGGYWVPQTVASLCFLTAGIMFTLITQEKWWKPLPKRIAWWIGVWATLGSIGFL